jgi:P-type Ca2+ transporter type 2C
MRRQVEWARLKGLADKAGGLTAAEVLRRRNQYGGNIIIETPAPGWIALLKDTARDPMIWFLIVSGGLFATVQQYSEALVLLAALVPLAGMDAFLHKRHRRLLKACAAASHRRLPSSAMVPP